MHNQSFVWASFGLNHFLITTLAAESALNDLCWIPDGIRSLPIDDQGGEFQLEPITEVEVEGEEAVSLEVPRGAVTPRGASVEVRYAVIPDGPFVPPDGYQFGSMVVYLYYNGQRVTRPITLHLPRWYGGVDHECDGVTLAMAPHTLKEGEEKYQFKVVEDREPAMWMRRQCGSHNLTGHCSLFAEVFRLGSTPTYYASLWTNQYSPTQVCSKVVVTYSHLYWLKVCLCEMLEIIWCIYCRRSGMSRPIEMHVFAHSQFANHTLAVEIYTTQSMPLILHVASSKILERVEDSRQAGSHCQVQIQWQ